MPLPSRRIARRDGRAIHHASAVLRRTVFALALCCVASRVDAQQTTISTLPASPTAGAAVTLVLFNSCGCPMYGTPVVRNGFTIDVPHGNVCLSACLPHTDPYALGPLGAGTYTVRHFLDKDPSIVEVIGTFVVGEGQGVAVVPALGVEGLTALTILIALAAWRLLRGSRGAELR